MSLSHLPLLVSSPITIHQHLLASPQGKGPMQPLSWPSSPNDSDVSGDDAARLGAKPTSPPSPTKSKSLMKSAKSALRRLSSRDEKDMTRPRSVYDRVGGQVLLDVVQCFVNKVVLDDHLSPVLAALRYSQHELMQNCMQCLNCLLDGPCSTDELGFLSQASSIQRKLFLRETGFSEEHFNRTIELLRGALLECRVAQNLVNEVVFLASLRKAWMMCDGVFDV
jgi:truncated hemoglobin YjbI